MSARPLPTALLALDIFATAVPVAGLIGFGGLGGFDTMLLSAAHPSLLAIAGIAASARGRVAEAGGIPAGWLLPTYVANVLGIFCLFMPVAQAADSLKRMMPDAFAAALLVTADIILLVAGQPKWTRLVMGAGGIPAIMRRAYCVLNPLRTGAAFLALFALTVPVI